MFCSHCGQDDVHGLVCGVSGCATPIAEGVYQDQPADEYHGGPGISKSGLDEIDRAPAHYWAAYLNPNRAQRRETPALRTGRAMHTAILEPEKFDAQFIVAPDVDRRTKEGKATWAAFMARAGARTTLPAAEYEQCRRLSDSVRAHPAASVLLQGGRCELSHYWRNQGVLCKTRPDYQHEWLVDLKSTVDARQESFMRSCWEYRYHVQAAWYSDGVQYTTGRAPAGFIFIAMEKQPPWLVACYQATPRMIERGRITYERNLATYAACLAADDWPGYADLIAPIDLPPWADKVDARQII